MKSIFLIEYKKDGVWRILGGIPFASMTAAKKELASERKFDREQGDKFEYRIRKFDECYPAK